MSTAAVIEIPNGAWSVDKIHSRAEFEVEHNGFSKFRGGFDDYDARLVVGATGIGVEGAARVTSVDVADEQLEGHLLSPEFFDAERHPEIKFRSTGYELTGDGTLRVSGELTIRGTTNRVEATGRIEGPTADLYGNRRIAVTLGTTIDRHDYGLDWNAELPSGGKALGDEVELSVSLELVEEAK